MGLGHRPWASTTTSSWGKRNEGRFHSKRVPLDLVGARPVSPETVQKSQVAVTLPIPRAEKTAGHDMYAEKTSYLSVGTFFTARRVRVDGAARGPHALAAVPVR